MMSAQRFGVVAGGLCAMLLAGCDTLGNPLDAMSPKRTGPDAFQVLARKELRMPASTGPEALAMPRPGAPSPLDPDPHGQAATALFGSDGAALASTSRMSRGEAALIDASAAGAVEPAEAARLARRIEVAEASKPYEPPSLLELFGAAGEQEIEPDLVLDPTAEATRLQLAGLRAPSDPDAVAPGSEPAPLIQSIGETGHPLEYSGYETGGNPRNTVRRAPQPAGESDASDTGTAAE